MRQRIIRDVGGTIRFFPPQCRQFGAVTAAVGGPPPVPGITIKDASGGDLLTPVVDVAATIDPVNTVVNGAGAAAAVHKIPVASNAGLVAGRRYLITKLTGEILVVRVWYWDANNVYLKGETPVALVAGDKLQGCELTYAVTAGNAKSAIGGGDDPLNYSGIRAGPKPINMQLFRAVWTYDVAGARYVRDMLFEINARLLDYTLEPDDVEAYLPDEYVHLARGGDTSQFAGVFDSAWSDLLDDCMRRGYKPDRIMDPDHLRKAHLLKVVALFFGSWGPRYADQAEKKEEKYMNELDAALSDGDWYDSNDDAKQQVGEEKYVGVTWTR